jgi:hypothetical protein
MNKKDQKKDISEIKSPIRRTSFNGIKKNLNESGEVKLKRAYGNLIRAQSETKGILAPVLVRMERARR